MAITVLLHVYHSTQQGRIGGPSTDVKVLVPNVDPKGGVGEQFKGFVLERLGVPLELQEITAPLSEELSDSQPASYLPHTFPCEPSSEASQVFIDEDSLSLWGIHTSNQIELADTDSLEENHVLDQSILRLRVLPQPLDREDGGRVFVETKSGVLPLLGIRPTTRVRFLKEMLFTLLGIPVSQQILSSAGQTMSDDQQMSAFEGLHAVYADSVLDLCCVGQPLKEQHHRRFVVHVSILDGREVSVVASGRDRVRDVMSAVENRTGLPLDQQKVTYNGKTLEESWLLKDVAACHDCTMHVAPYNSLLRSISYGTSSEEKVHLYHPEFLSPAREESDTWESASGTKGKIKLMRVKDGRVVGTVRLPFASGDSVADLKRRVGRLLRSRSLDANECSRDSFEPLRAAEIRPRHVVKKARAPSAGVQPLGTPSPLNRLKTSKSLDGDFSFVQPPPSVLASDKSLGQSMSLGAWKRQQDRLEAARRSAERVVALEDESRLKVREWLASDESFALNELPLNKQILPVKRKQGWFGGRLKMLRKLRIMSGH